MGLTERTAFHLWDGNEWYTHETEAAAAAAAEEAIGIARDWCDPEWPSSVEEIAVYAAPIGCDEPDEDGRLVLIATEEKIRDAEPGEGVDYWCDYKMAAPK